MHSDNPAARLLKILEKGKKVQQGANCRNTWHELLEVDREEPALLMYRLGKVMELTDLIIREIKDNYPNQTNSHKYWSNKVNTAFMQQNLNGQWKDFIVHIDEHTISSLNMCTDLLDNKSSTQLMALDEIKNIREKINTLLLEAINLDLDPEFKRYIVRYLKKIITAIDEYQLSGAIPISEAIEGAFGHAFVDENYRNNMSETEFGSKVVSVLGAVASIVTIAVGLPQLPDTFNYLLTKSK